MARMRHKREPMATANVPLKFKRSYMDSSGKKFHSYRGGLKLPNGESVSIELSIDDSDKVIIVEPRTERYSPAIFVRTALWEKENMSNYKSR